MNIAKDKIEKTPVDYALEKHKRLFNVIAPIYNVFFNYQVKHYRTTLNQYHAVLGLPESGTVLDLGCGTGALLYALAEAGYKGTGVDMAPRMLEQARQSTKKYPIPFHLADVTQGLPFPDQNFDFVVSSYVLHGVNQDLRLKIYQEARRVARQQVLFFDYNTSRRLLTDVVEWAEGGDYFNFIKQAEQEMREVFTDVKKHSLSPYSAIYQCKQAHAVSNKIED